jgi:hypothetical protein
MDLNLFLSPSRLDDKNISYDNIVTASLGHITSSSIASTASLCPDKLNFPTAVTLFDNG